MNCDNNYVALVPSKGKTEYESSFCVCYKIIKNIVLLRNKLFLVLIWRSIMMILLIYQIYRMADFFISYNKLKKSDQPFYFDAICNCTNMYAMNGTAIDIITGRQYLWTDTKDANPPFYLLYAFIISFK